MKEQPPDEHDPDVPRDARLQASWAERVWRRSHEGNWYLNAEGFNLVVSHRGGEWTVFIRNRETQRAQAGRRTYPTLEAAKLAACDALMWARRNL